MSYIAIVGSRVINSDTANMVRAYVDGIADDNEAWAEPRHTVLSGGATGVDEVARQAAKDRRVPFKLYAADWKTYGKAAGPIRNVAMVKDADVVVAFWDGVSKGTRHTIEAALVQRKRLEVFFPDDAVEWHE